MTTYVVHGKLGAGKGKFVVDKMLQALSDGRRVATNMDLYLEHLCHAGSRRTVIRIPDKPTPADLDAIGHGNPDSYDEDRNGVLVLDEAGTWLNARSFMDKDRQGFIDWMLHARKKGWDVYLQVQDIAMVDKQFRTGLAEIIVRCINAKKMKIPFVGWMLTKGVRKRLQFHIANFTLADVPGIVIDREWYRGEHLHKAYDTRQVFRADYPHGVHSLLSAWHLKGRFEVKEAKRRSWFARPARPEPKPKLPLVQLLERLPPDRRLVWSARLAREGLL